MQLLVVGLRNLVLRGAPVDGRYDQAPVNLLAMLDGKLD